MKFPDVYRLIPGYDPVATCGDSWFDVEAAERACDFFPQYLRHIEGSLAGKPFVLEPWEQAIVGNLHGWKRRDAKGRIVRRYREALIFVPRKNGKTPFCAGLGLEALFLDEEVGQQDYIAASVREQAGLLFRHCRGMVEQDADLAANCRIYGGNAPGGQAMSIVRESLGSFLKTISGDASVGSHGKNLNVAIIDELHELPNRGLVDVLRTSMASANKPQPMLIYATTSDFERPGSICNEVHDYASKVRDGVIDDPRFLPVIYEAAKDDDWTSPTTWAKANPNLGVSVSEEYLAAECERAKENPSLQNLFRRLHLNQRTEQAVRWLDLSAWDATDHEFGDGDLEGIPCFGGLDLSTTTDLAALAMDFVAEGGRHLCKLKFWVPEENARKREKRDRVPYLRWIAEGWITPTPGSSIDYDRIRADINDLRQSFPLKQIAADRWNATQLIGQLKGDDFDVIAHGQGYRDMSAPSKELERLIAARLIACNRHPVLGWMASNVAAEQDAAGNIKPSKAKSSERIDGIVALVMAISLATRAGAEAPAGRSIYDDLDHIIFV